MLQIGSDLKRSRSSRSWSNRVLFWNKTIWVSLCYTNTKSAIEGNRETMQPTVCVKCDPTEIVLTQRSALAHTTLRKARKEHDQMARADPITFQNAPTGHWQRTNSVCEGTWVRRWECFNELAWCTAPGRAIPVCAWALQYLLVRNR